MSVVRLHIGPADRGRPMTLEESREAEEQPGYRYEPAGGVLEVVDGPGADPGRMVDNLHRAISPYRRGHPGRIRRIARGRDVRLLIPEPESDRHPDLAVVFRGAPLNARPRRVPRWISEVVPPGAEARRPGHEVESEEYQALNIGECRIIDPFERKVTVRVHQETPEGPVWSQRVFTGDEIIISERLPGFQGTVAGPRADAEPGPEEGDGGSEGGHRGDGPHEDRGAQGGEGPAAVRPVLDPHGGGEGARGQASRRDGPGERPLPDRVVHLAVGRWGEDRHRAGGVAGVPGSAAIAIGGLAGGPGSAAIAIGGLAGGGPGCRGQRGPITSSAGSHGPLG